MVTVMSWGDKNGTRGRCDAKCHTAVYPRCVCMCNGSFHGAAKRPGGLEKAIEDFWEGVVDEAQKKCEKEKIELRVKSIEKIKMEIKKDDEKKPVQLNLF